jgi:exosortase
MTIPGLLALCFCVFWPVTIWYVERLLDKSDEPLGLISLIAFIAVVLSRKCNESRKEVRRIPLSSIVCVLAYIITWPIAPKLLSAILAVLAIGCMINGAGKLRMNLGSWLLLLFSLPIVSSLNFYSGYPLRLVVGKIAAPLISMVGFPTIADGTTLMWGEHLVQIDAPCSGIKMLWFSLFIGAVLTSIFELHFFRAVVVLSASVLAALLGNILRITSLFFVEANIVHVDPALDQFVHQSVGAVAFAISAGITVLVATRFPKNGAAEETKETADESPPDFALPARDRSIDAEVANDKLPPLSQAMPSTGLKKTILNDRRMLSFLALAVIAALVPVVFTRSEDRSVLTSAFPGWPKEYNGRILQQVPPKKADAAFYQEFPGKIQCFAQGERRIIIRWVAKPTRQLHPSSDCFRGLGYDITYKPLETDMNGVRRSCFGAAKDGKSFAVKERIYDDAGGNWTDISSWYWAALLGKTHGPWWSIVEIAPAS